MRKGLAAGHGGINSKFEAGWWETERSNRTECSLQLTPGDWESSCTGNSTPHNPNPWRCSPGQAALGTTAPILQWTTKTRLKAGMEQIGGGRPGSPLAFGCWRMQINELLAITHPEEHETAPIQFPKKVICVFGWNTRHSTLDILVPFCWKWLWLCRILCLLISGYQEIYQTSQADTKMVQHLPSNCHKQISDSDPPKLTLAVEFLINNWANLTESLHSSEIQYINDKNVVIFQKKRGQLELLSRSLGVCSLVNKMGSNALSLVERSTISDIMQFTPNTNNLNTIPKCKLHCWYSVFKKNPSIDWGRWTCVI